MPLPATCARRRAAVRLSRPVVRIHRAGSADGAPEIAHGRVIVAHLGSGASMCALRGGKSMDSTFGSRRWTDSAWARVPAQSTPGVILHLFQTSASPPRRSRDSVQEVRTARDLRHQQRHARSAFGNDRGRRARSGLLRVSACKQIGAMAGALGGVDGLVFTAGIGENSAEIRKRICAGLRVARDRTSTPTRNASRPSDHTPVASLGVGGPDQRGTHDCPPHGQTARPDARVGRLTH